MTISTYAIPGITDRKRVNAGMQINKLIHIGCEFLNVNVDDIKGSCRKRELATPRSLLMHYFTTKHYSFREIGEQFYRDHSTVIHSKKLVNKLITVYPELNALKNNLYNHLNLNS